MIKNQTNSQEVNKQLSKININYIQIKSKSYRAKAMIHSGQINIIDITSQTEWNRTT